VKVTNLKYYYNDKFIHYNTIVSIGDWGNRTSYVSIGSKITITILIRTKHIKYSAKTMRWRSTRVGCVNYDVVVYLRIYIEDNSVSSFGRKGCDEIKSI